MRHFDLCIIGSGSGNSIADERFAGLTVALVEKGTFGGTCLNVGCIPTKMYVYPADLALEPTRSSALGVDLELHQVHWDQIRDRIFGRIDPIAAGGKRWREQSENVTVFSETAHFVGPKTLDTGSGGVITADRFVIAAGSRVAVPGFPGLDGVDYRTSDDVMRLPRLPKSMIIVGAGYVASEFAHVFSAYGVAVTVVGRSSVMLRNEDDDVAQRFTELMGRRVDLRLNANVERVTAMAHGLKQVVIVDDVGARHELVAEELLIATGRVPNGDTLDLAATEVAVDDDGYIVVDEFQRTSVDGIYALGDVSSHHQLKHVANHEARVVQHNLLHPDDLVASDHRYIPHAVFSEPQVASVGLTERAARDQGLDFSVGRTDYGSTAYGWAMEDQDHFVKLISDKGTGLLLGAHLIGPQASSLIQPLIQAMSFGTPAHAVARGQYWIHPAMAEVIENALLDLESD
ncbi:MAG TPA: mycothione reductase [Propionibacteriaceae bacterium]